MMFSVLWKLRWFFREHWLRYTIAVSLLFVAGILEILPPRWIGMAIDDMKTGLMTPFRLMHYVAGVLVIAAIIYVITYIWMYQLFGGAFLLEKRMRSRLMRHLLRMTPHFYEQHRTGDLMARATNDLKAVSMTAGFGILTLVDSSLFMLTILGVMSITISWKLTLAALSPMPLVALSIGYFGKKIHRRFMEAQSAFGDTNNMVLETISGIRVIRAYVQERASERRFHHLTEEVYNKNVKVAEIDSLFEPSVKVLVSISYLVGIVYGAVLVFHSELTLGELVSFNVYLGMLIWPMIAIGELINVMQRGNASLDRVNDTLSSSPDVEEPPQPVHLERPGMIRFDKVSFRYPSSNRDNLQDISFCLRRGETLGIVGKTGSGKSTLLKQLLREFPPGPGAVTISDVRMDQISLGQLRGWMGYVPQEHVLFSKTVQDNIRFGMKESPSVSDAEDGFEQSLERAMETAAFKKDVPLLPQGLATLVGEKGVALSGGQKQRLSIARAVIGEPEILILDDALSAVDGKTETEIIGQIRSARSGRTTLIATHRLTAVQHADLILVLDEGRILQSGTHEQLMAEGGWYREQYDLQQMEEDV